MEKIWSTLNKSVQKVSQRYSLALDLLNNILKLWGNLMLREMIFSPLKFNSLIMDGAWQLEGASLHLVKVSCT